MRALVLGVVGAVLAVGVAEAKGCRLDGVDLIAKEQGPAELGRPDLVGQRFKVVRVASWTKVISGRDKNEKTTVADIAVALEGKAGRFVVDQGYVPHSAPWISATSWSVSGRRSEWAGLDKVETVNWAKRNRRAEAAYFAQPVASFNVYGGPFSGMTLEPVRCR